MIDERVRKEVARLKEKGVSTAIPSPGSLESVGVQSMGF
jgi:hypothetical protein